MSQKTAQKNFIVWMSNFPIIDHDDPIERVVVKLEIHVSNEIANKVSTAAFSPWVRISTPRRGEEILEVTYIAPVEYLLHRATDALERFRLTLLDWEPGEHGYMHHACRPAAREIPSRMAFFWNVEESGSSVFNPLY